MPTVAEPATKKRKFNQVSKAHDLPPAHENAQLTHSYNPQNNSGTVDSFIKSRRHTRKVVDATIGFAESIKGLLSALEDISFPSSIFEAEDYLEFRYFRKRAVYLAYVASALLDHSSHYSCQFDFLDGDELRPIILINNPSMKSVVRIILAIPSDLFPLSKLSPSACCALLDTGVPTPQYNASIISDAHHFKNAKIRREFATSHPGFEGGLVLGSIWLSYQNYSSHLLDGGFGDNEWALLQSYIIGKDAGLQSSQQLSDPYQMFTSVLKFIAKMEPPAQLPNEIDHPSCVWNGTVYNILFKMSRWAYLALKHDAYAILSLQQLASSTRNLFIRTLLEGENQRQQDVDLIAMYATSMPCS
ncbi:hypothetical protein ABW21_db0205165 [Orbilia brochopaga]|nr:hypothetical protein ABW21_db0205165 [Drechslerella brochopaga]